VPPLEFWLFAAGSVGLVVGSYLNVLVHRLPLGISTVTPASHCPACGSAIRAHDNIPLLSWLVLGGRCRDCGAPIGVRYPLVELLSGAGFAGAVARFGPTLEALAGALLFALLLALAGIDLEHLLLPDKLTLTGTALGLAAQLALPTGSLARGVAGALVGAGFLLAVAGLWEVLRGSEGMGLGDVKMLAMIGAFLGVPGVAVTLVVGTLVGSAVGLALIAVGRGAMGSKLPFGVFLAAGGAVALFFGEALVALYLGVLR
jgi:leader peptidase (prepilin peptidase)/N-methyltransferase